MGIGLKISGAAFTKTVGSIYLPVRTGLVGEYYFGTSSVESIKNRANAAKPLYETGTITYNAYDAQFLGGANGFDTANVPATPSTGIQETTEFTLIFVGKLTAGGLAAVISNFHSVTNGNGYNSSLLTSTTAGNNYVQHATNTTAATNITRAYVDESIDSIVIARVNVLTATSYKIRLAVYRAGVIVTSSELTVATARQIRSTLSYKIGIANASLTGATINARAAAIYSVCLSDGEVADAVSHLTTYFANRGITI